MGEHQSGCLKWCNNSVGELLPLPHWYLLDEKAARSGDTCYLLSISSGGRKLLLAAKSM